MTTDAFLAAFRFPNMFRRIFGEGAFNSAFVPLFGRKLEEEGKPEALLFARNAFSTLMLVLGVGSIIAILTMEFLMMAVVPGFRPKFERDLTNVGKSHASYTVEIDTQGARGVYIQLESGDSEKRRLWGERIKLNEILLENREGEEGNSESPVISGDLAEDGLIKIEFPNGHSYSTFRTVIEVGDLEVNADVYAADLRVYRNDPVTFDLTVKLSRIMFCYLLCMALAAHLGGVLNTFKSFAMPAAAPIILNLCFLGAFGWMWYTGQEEIETVAWAVALAGFLQLGALWLTCFVKKAPILPMRPRMTPEMKRLFLLMGPGILAAGIQQVNLLIGGIIASFQEGGITFLYGSERVYQLPLGMIGISLGVVLLPQVTRQLRGGDEEAAGNSILRGMEWGLLLTIPCAVAMLLIPLPVIATLFERGDWTRFDSIQTAYALAGFAFGLPGYVLIKVLQPGYFAREDTKSPMIMAGITVLVNVVCSIALFLLLRPYGFGHVGIAVATSIAAWVNAFLLWRGLKGFVKMHRRGRKKMRRMLVASALMGAVVWCGWLGLQDFFEDGPWHKAGVLALLVGMGVVAYAWLVLKLKVTTIADLREGFGK